ncbi:low molecular weight protein-tyrosine-phosphatase [Alteribacillus sp. HJP-4]|uniref:low molecular weight protein-tyrosine-phosphatase n=1 Tax=Alteribacillus sp. HJP-4 TaxID=2775394 RepID=UPI0035CD2CF9
MKVRVLFVCLGNICRSPMAESIFTYKTKQAGLENFIESASAGIGNWHEGDAPHRGTLKVLDNQGIDGTSLRASQIKSSDAVEFDYILVMDDDNMHALMDLKMTEQSAFIGKLLDFHPFQRGGNVPDPYFNGNFDDTYLLIESSCTHFLEWLRKRENL